MSKKIFFFHNPKAGGSSLTRVLESYFPSGKRCPIIENTMADHENRGGDYFCFRGYDLYAGHYGRDIFTVVSDGHVYTTNFRHPTARLLSLYNYFKSVIVSDKVLYSSGFYAVLAAKSLSFHDFISADDPRINVYVYNAHFRQLTNSFWSLKYAQGFADVCRFIDGMGWYFVCEYPELSLVWTRRAFDFEVDQIPRENVTGDQGDQIIRLTTLEDRTHKIICEKNDLDFAIYKYAVDRFLSCATG
jgi:hypothetical protein